MKHRIIALYLGAAGVVHLFSLFGAAIAFLMGSTDFLDGPSIPEHVVMSLLLVVWGYFRGELK